MRLRTRPTIWTAMSAVKRRPLTALAPAAVTALARWVLSRARLAEELLDPLSHDRGVVGLNRALARGRALPRQAIGILHVPAKGLRQGGRIVLGRDDLADAVGDHVGHA